MSRSAKRQRDRALAGPQRCDDDRLPCPGRKPPFSHVQHPARPYKSAIDKSIYIGKRYARLTTPGGPGQSRQSIARPLSSPVHAASKAPADRYAGPDGAGPTGAPAELPERERCYVGPEDASWPMCSGGNTAIKGWSWPNFWADLASFSLGRGRGRAGQAVGDLPPRQSGP